MAVGIGELEAPTAAIGEYHSQPAPAGGDGGAGERLDTGDLRVALGYPVRQIAGHRHHAVLGQRDLGDGRLLERPVDVLEQRGLEPVAADGDHQLAGVVVEQQPRAVHAGQVAQRGAEGVVEAPSAGVGLAVELAQQLDDHIQRVGARRGRHVGVVPVRRAEATVAAPAQW